jgi:chromosome segregation ATPase
MRQRQIAAEIRIADLQRADRQNQWLIRRLRSRVRTAGLSLAFVRETLGQKVQRLEQLEVEVAELRAELRAFQLENARITAAEGGDVCEAL